MATENDWKALIFQPARFMLSLTSHSSVVENHRTNHPLTIANLILTLTLAANVVCADEPELVKLFGSEPPKVEISTRQALIRDRDGNTLPCYLSVKDRVAVTTAQVPEVNFRVFGELIVWDLSSGRVRHTIRTPARITSMAGIRGSGQIAVAGGPLGKDTNPPFVWIVDLASGAVLTEFSPHHHSAYGLEIRLSPDGRFVVVREGDGPDAAYDSKSPKDAARMLDRKIWNQLLVTTSESANENSKTPGKLVRIGDMDDGFALAEDEAGFNGLWRTDSWQRVTAFGHQLPEWQSWATSADGNKLVTWRHNSIDGFTIWDFTSFRVTSVEETEFRPELSPAFSASGRFVRYKRAKIDTGEIEIVSLDLDSGMKTVAMSFAADDFTSYHEAKWHGVFSANGEHLLVVPGSSQTPVRISWNEAGEASVGKLGVKLGDPISISDDGGRVTATAGSKDLTDVVEYYVDHIDLRSGSRVGRWAVPTVGHSPIFSATHHPTLPNVVALCQHTTGASLGYYSGDVAILDGNKVHRVPGFLVSEDLHPLDREANAWSVNFLRPSGGSNWLLGIYSNNGRFATYDPARNAFAHRIQWADYRSEVRDREFGFAILRNVAAQRSGRIFVPTVSGSILVVDIAADGSASRKAELFALPDQGWFAVRPDGYYSISTDGGRYVFFRKGERTHSFEQYDAFLNRPDRVAAALGASSADVDILKRAYQRRLRALGRADSEQLPELDKSPSLEVRTQPPLKFDNEKISLPVVAHSRSGAPLSSVELSINGVPVESITPSSSSASLQANVQVLLAPGENQIRLSARDSSGLESSASIIRIHRQQTELSQPDLYLLGIGVADYADDRLDLEYCAKDATEIVAAFRKIGAGFGNVREKLILNRDATRAGVLAARDFLRQSKPGDRMVVFIAGHGTLSDDFRYFFCTHEFDPDNMSTTGLSFEEVESLFDQVPARERLLLMDTCQAGAVDAELLASLETRNVALADGVRAVISPLLRTAASDTSSAASSTNQRFVEELFADLKKGTGATVLSAAGGLEFALEGGGLSNGVFSHAVIEALGDSSTTDSNGDGIIRASELISHVSRRVIDTTGGLQHPNLRSVNFAIDFPLSSLEVKVAPDAPKIFLQRYLERSSVHVEIEATPIARVVAMFADRVVYFDKTLGHAEIRADIEEYNAKYDERHYKLRPGVNVDFSKDGSMATLDYVMDFRAGFFDLITVNVPGEGPQKLKSRAYRDGTLKMRMQLVWNGSEWKIVKLGTRK